MVVNNGIPSTSPLPTYTWGCPWRLGRAIIPRAGSINSPNCSVPFSGRQSLDQAHLRYLNLLSLAWTAPQSHARRQAVSLSGRHRQRVSGLFGWSGLGFVYHDYQPGHPSPLLFLPSGHPGIHLHCRSWIKRLLHSSQRMQQRINLSLFTGLLWKNFGGALGLMWMKTIAGSLAHWTTSSWISLSTWR